MGACSHDDEHDAYKHWVEDEMIAGRTPPRFHEPEQEPARDEAGLCVEGLILLAIVFVVLAVYVSAAGAIRRFLR